MRITGGRARGIPLAAPKGKLTRPATDQMREAVFSSLGAQVEGTRIADLFAGTGAYGLEAMSRGAARGIFVESDRKVLNCLQKNLAAVAKSCAARSADWRTIAQKVDAGLRSEGPFDLVFVDPPYEMIVGQIPQMFADHIAPLVADNGRLCFEMPGQLELPLAGWSVIRRLGKSGKDRPSVVFYQRESNGESRQPAYRLNRPVDF